MEQKSLDEQKIQYITLLDDIKSGKLTNVCLEKFRNEKEDFSVGENVHQLQKEPFFFEDQFKVDSEGGVEFINTEVIKKQRGILPAILKSLGSAIINGKPLGSISLPYEVLVDYSILERTANTLSYAPHFLEKGGQIDDPYQQFCIAISHWVASFHLAAYQYTPIEPLLGETFQGKIGGCPVYFEQMSPFEGGNATVGFYLAGKNFTVGGSWLIAASISPNSVKGQLIGPSETHFKNNGTKVFFQHPYCQISGTAFGKRQVDYGGKFYAWDPKSRLVAELEVDPPADGFFSKKTTKTDFIRGRIVVGKDSLFKKIQEAVAKKKTFEIKFEKDDIAEEKDKIEGSWLNNLKVGGKVYWAFGAIKPFKLFKCTRVLPSDSNLRPDALWKRLGDDTNAEKSREPLKIQELKDIKSMKKKKEKKGFFF